MPKLTREDFFYCYTYELSNYLAKNGYKYILKAISVKNGITFTLYEKTEELQRLLDDYSSHKK